MISTAGSTPHHHIVDLGCIKVVPGLKTVENLSEDPLRVHLVQGAGFLSLASRRPYCIDDPGFVFHLIFSFRELNPVEAL